MSDADLVLAQVDRFARREIEPRVERPERPIGGVEVAAIMTAADALGLAGSDGDPSGLGLWEDLGGAQTLAILRRLGRASAAVALALHQRALARAVARRLGLAAPAPLLAIAWGGHGVGRDAAARMLAGAPLTVDDIDLLAAAWARDVARVVTSDDRWAAIALPVIAADGVLAWEVWPRAAVVITPAPHAHGLDELVTATIAPRAAPLLRADGAEAHAAWAFALAATALGHVAIGCGTVARGHALARAYAAQRLQGGAPIDRHDAVRLLLARGTTALDTSFAVALAAAACGDGAAATIAAFGARVEALPALAAAANDALQTFGGLGYMRDTGAEKVVRDVNHLRALGGSPGELALVISEWERIHARAA
jgi:alkylation response protein AidB-like acyl-CoA dehydrogenase